MATTQQQVQPVPGPEEGPQAGGAAQTPVSGVDDVLDEIDAVLEANAAAFVQGFVQKGGQ